MDPADFVFTFETGTEPEPPTLRVPADTWPKTRARIAAHIRAHTGDPDAELRFNKVNDGPNALVTTRIEITDTDGDHVATATPTTERNTP